MPEPINTTTMPGDNMFPDQIDASAGKMRTIGTQVSSKGATVLTTWQKISAHYDAPEENTLFHAMNPVKTEAEKFGTDVGKAATALETFADEVRTIKTAVAAIRADAADFKAEIANGVEKTTVGARGMSTGTETIAWHEDAASVKKNNDLIQRTRDQQEALWAAERACASTIRGLVGLSPITAASESNPNGYGLDEIPDGMPTAWGDKVEKTENCGESVVHGVANGVGAMGEGFGALVGFKYTGSGLWNEWDWQWDHSWGNAGETWTGIGKFALGGVTLGLPGTTYALFGNGPGSDLLRDSQMTFAAGIAGLVAIDAYNSDPFHKWKKSPGQAIGESGFNIATIVLAPTKVGNVGKAGTLGKAGEIGAAALRMTDPLYWTTKAGTAIKSALGPTVESLLRLNKAADFDTTFNVTKEIELPTVDRTGVDTPNGPGTDAPAPRDYTEPQSRHDSGNSPDQSPAPDRQPTPDREPAVVGGRGDSDPAPSNRGGGDDSAPTGGGRDTDTTPTNRDGDDTPATTNRDGDDTPATTNRDGDDTPATTNRDGDDTPATTNRGGDDTPATTNRDDTPATTNRDGDDTPATTNRDGDDTPATTNRDGDDTPATTNRDGDDGGAQGDHGGDSAPSGDNGVDSNAVPHGHNDVPSGQAYQTWENLTHGYGPDTHHLDPQHPKVDLGNNSSNLGKYGERLTEQDLVDRGYTIVAREPQIQLPSGKYFKPDFLAYDPQTQSLILVESKMGSGAKFTPNQLEGYNHYAQGQHDLVGRSIVTDKALDRALQLNQVNTRKVGSVEVYRWNTDVVPDQTLRTRARVP